MWTPKRLLLVNRSAKWAWILAIPITELTSLKTALPWLLFMSLWANVVSHWTTERALEAEIAASDAQTED